MTRFTKNEADLIEHRLGIPEAIAEVLRDDDDTRAAFVINDDDVYSICMTLKTDIRKRAIEDIVKEAGPLRIAILRNAVEFSTLVIRADDEAAFENKPYIYRSAVKALEGAAAKLRNVGVEIDTRLAYP